MNNKKLENYNLTNELNDAIKLINQVYSETGTVPTSTDIDSYILQPTLGADFGASAIDLYDATVQVFAKTIVKGQNDLKKVVSLYNSQGVDYEAGQADMFSGILSKDELINLVLTQSGYGQEKTIARQGQETSSKTATSSESTAGQSGSEQQVKSQEEIDTELLDANIAAQKPNVNPTDKQKESGAYDKARVNIQGYNITVETVKGTQRSGTDSNGKAWAVTMNNHYGELDGTTGYDGDPIDVFIGNDPKQGNIYAIDQMNPETGAFDETKVMLGFDSAEQAKAAYMSNFEDGWQGFGNITPASDNFKVWLYYGKKQRKPYSEYKDTPEAIENNSSEKPNTSQQFPDSGKTIDKPVEADNMKFQAAVDNSKQIDEQYFSAIERGDMEEAQRIVDQQAEITAIFQKTIIN